MHMPLHTSQEAPSFCGAAKTLSCYLTTIEALCLGRGKSTGPELIKYAVYYADEMSEDSFTTAKDALADLTSWEEFKHALCKMYPQHEVVHTPEIGRASCRERV